MEEIKEINPVYLIESKHAFNKIMARMQEKKLWRLKKKGCLINVPSKVKPPKTLDDIYNSAFKF